MLIFKQAPRSFGCANISRVEVIGYFAPNVFQASSVGSFVCVFVYALDRLDARFDIEMAVPEFQQIGAYMVRQNDCPTDRERRYGREKCDADDMRDNHSS